MIRLSTIIIAATILATCSATSRSNNLRHAPPPRKLLLPTLSDTLAALKETIDSFYASTPDVLNIKVWDAADGDDLTKYPWPEQQIASVMEKENVGIAISGGGSRSMAAAHGQLAALHKTGLLKKARYLNGVSGGAWAVTAYTYNQKGFSDDVLLGGIIEPQDATMERLSEMDETRLGFGATTDMFTTLVSQLVQSKVGLAESGDLWVTGVTEKVLSHYGIKEDAFFAYDQAQLDQIKSRNPDLDKEFILPKDGSRPFALVHSAYMGPFKGRAIEDDLAQLSSTSPKYYTNLDICGLYSGYPLKRSFTVDEKSGSIDVKQGGLVETFGWNSPTSDLDVSAYDETTKMQTVDARKQTESQGLPMGAAAAAGASSTWGTYDHYFYEKCENDCVQDVTGQDLLDTIAGSLGAPVVGQLASDSAKWDADSEHHLYRLGDGGATGVVTPIHQLIARGVTKVIAFANYDNKFVTDKQKWSPKNGSPDFIPKESIDGTTPLWFGVPTFELKYGSIDYDPAHGQIFQKQKWPEFVDCLQDAANSGKGAFCKMTLKTVANAHWGIPADLDIELAYFYLKSASAFDSQLPTETQAEIADLENGKIKNFPQYFTLLNNAQGLSVGTVATNTVGITDIGVEEANLLASQTNWVTKEHMQELKSMFSSATIAPTMSPTMAPTSVVEGFWNRFKSF